MRAVRKGAFAPVHVNERAIALPRKSGRNVPEMRKNRLGSGKIIAN
jgi:hypothetical protein